MALELKTSATLLLSLRSLDNQTGWERFRSEYEPLMASWLQRLGITGNRLLDILSDVYLKLVQHFPKFIYDDSKSFRSWLKTVVENTLRDAMRKSSRSHEVCFDNSVLETASIDLFGPNDIDEMFSPYEERMQVARTIISRVRDRVAAKTWDAFYFTEIEGHSCSEVATELGMRENQVYIARFRVRRFLREEGARIDGTSLIA
ncbi:RNA polymerase sigma factor [Pirellulaceae bacterium SH449]